MGGGLCGFLLLRGLPFMPVVPFMGWASVHAHNLGAWGCGDYGRFGHNHGL
ncbi:hypothetical protein SGFS_041810 [Streptomyces graminofaciens]|uniref:Uncharacterized protein n=1 Tax=Streptomyces graminofaciens TaxID=68212 RepID=A0ABM7FA60_9ACTN|nr:hypothetical protein SGFS_041810 [Streptomyces graminofaciens]